MTVRPSDAGTDAVRHITVEIDAPFDLAATTGPLANGPRDPVQRSVGATIVRALWVDGAPGTIALTATTAGTVTASWWGSADIGLAALAHDLLGAHDDPASFTPTEGPLAALARRGRGMRFARDAGALPTVVAAVFGQRVTAQEAHRGWRELVLAHGETAPGPHGLRVPPSAETLAAMPYYAFHRFGLDRRRAETLRRAAAVIARHGDDRSVVARLGDVPGIGPWTRALLRRDVLGDPDAPIVGDYHLPHAVVYALTGRPRGSDEEMLALLEPHRPHRGRAQRLLVRATRAPRFGPGRRIHRIDRL